VESTQDVSHVIVHIKSKKPYTTMTIDFGSKYIGEQVYQHFAAEAEQDLVQFLRASDGQGEYAALRGLVFEGRAHKQLQKGGEFKVRDLDTNKITKIQISPTTLQTISTLEFPYDPTLYCQPIVGNFAAVDSWIDGKGFFQMTISPTHPIKRKKMETLVDASKMNLIYFVVPSGKVCDEFIKQKFQDGNKIVSAPKLHTLKQYVLELPSVIAPGKSTALKPAAKPTKAPSKSATKTAGKKRPHNSSDDDDDDEDSQPKQKKQKKDQSYICPDCKKEYKRKHFYDAHVEKGGCKKS